MLDSEESFQLRDLDVELPTKASSILKPCLNGERYSKARDSLYPCNHMLNK